MADRIQLNLRLDGHRELLDAIKTQAEAQDISVNAFVIRALRIAVGGEAELAPSLASAAVTPANLEETLFPMLDKMLGDRLAQIEERLGKLRA